MAKEKADKNVLPEVEIVSKEVKSDRDARWEAYVAAYAKANPVKYEAKKARGEFKQVPDSFR